MDDEITGMYQMAKILDGLDEQARGRLIRWAADKYGVDVGQSADLDDGAVDAAARSVFMEVDPDKVAAARAARASGETSAAVAAKLGAMTPEPDDAPPQRDPGKPSFLDTSFRMYSGKRELKKAKDEKK